jgi:hypothetical protein
MHSKQKMIIMKPLQLIGKFAILTAPSIGPAGFPDFNYSNNDLFTNKALSYVKRFFLIDHIEGKKIFTQKILLVTGKTNQQIIEGEQWFYDSRTPVGKDGKIEG